MELVQKNRRIKVPVFSTNLTINNNRLATDSSRIYFQRGFAQVKAHLNRPGVVIVDVYFSN